MIVEIPRYSFEPKKNGIPDILQKPFASGVNVYTMIFVYEAYSRNLYNRFSQVQRDLFDKYFITDFSISDLPSRSKRENFINIIKNGFVILRNSFPEEYVKYFPENKLPLFKHKDKSVIDKTEKMKFTRATISLRNRQRITSEETRKKISLKSRGRIVSEETKNKVSVKMRGRTFSDQSRDKMKISAKRRYENSDEYRCNMTRNLKRGGPSGFKDKKHKPEVIEMLRQRSIMMWKDESMAAFIRERQRTYYTQLSAQKE
jgi:hypothetical protein